MIRVRFAPSPTGPLHIGGLRTALYNYLFAKKDRGQFILRIEDTDQNRYVEGAEKYILESLNWAGFSFDEGPGIGGDFGPYRQSERKDIYAEYCLKLINNGTAYYAFDTAADLDKMRADREAEGIHSPKYDHKVRGQMRNSLTLDKGEVDQLLSVNTPYTIRLKVEAGRQISFVDEIRGSVTFSSDELDDKILMKSDGMPTYHLANVVDDHLMEISHVIRGEEWLSSTAHHVLLYEAFGWTDSRPAFAHLPLILKPTGKGKLSKRDGQKLGIPVFPLDWQAEDGLSQGFREFGILPKAAVNFLAFLGWNPGTEQELFSLEELVAAFSLEKVSKSGARFDFDKAKWFNQQHLLATSDADLFEITKSIFEEKGIVKSDEFIQSYVTLFKPRIELLTEIVTVGNYCFEKPTSYNEKIIRKKWKPAVHELYASISTATEVVTDWRAEMIKAPIDELISHSDIGYGAILPLLRIAISGDVKGPDLFETLELIGQEETCTRLKSAVDLFNDKTQV